jgi:hypothetical protein
MHPRRGRVSSYGQELQSSVSTTLGWARLNRHGELQSEASSAVADKARVLYYKQKQKDVPSLGQSDAANRKT